MGLLRWLFGRVERLAVFVCTIATGAVAVIQLGDYLEPAPVLTAPPAPPGADAPAEVALPEGVPPDFSAPLSRRLSAAVAAAGCSPSAVSAADYVERLTPAGQTSHGRDAAFVQLELAGPGGRMTLQGNGRGAAALVDARANLLDNVETALKENASCG